MFTKVFLLFALTFAFSTLQAYSKRDGRLTVVNIYSGLESVGGDHQEVRSFTAKVSKKDVVESDEEDNNDKTDNADIHDDDGKIKEMSDDTDDSDENEDSDNNEDDDEDIPDDDDDDLDEDEDDEECCKVTYGNPKLTAGQLWKVEKKPVTNINNKKKKKKKNKHALKQKRVFYKGKNENYVAVSTTTTVKPVIMPVVSPTNITMSWENFKKLIATLRL